MFMEIDQVALPKGMWADACMGAENGVERARKYVDGLDLYTHALSAHPKDYEWVSLRDLEFWNIVESIKINAR